MDEETAKQKIKELVDKYNTVAEGKREYSEADTKAEFIEPLFEYLGWDVRNKCLQDEVTREETISKKRPDYGFRINGIPKFFLETKALKADLDKPEYAEQAINYAWHKDCTWAVLTNFETIKIFNAEWKTADLMQSRFISLEYDKFLERFGRLRLLSKESFEQGLLDKEAEEVGKKSKKSHVGEQLFSDLTKWRSELSKDISQRNKGINEVDLDEAVQRIIDRLIFIRNCEDRDLEAPRLLPTVREWDSNRRGTLWEHVVRMFRGFDDDYNSKLFHPHQCEKLDISNQSLMEVINGLYRTKDKSIRYDFSALDADVLGNVYEQYLGHILKKTAKRAIVEEKHAYRKEQGIYYTPTYIVDYIVRNTLGELLKDKKVNVEKISVLDPACGSGSFLIKAFDVLNEFYIKSVGDHAQTKFDLATGLPFKLKERILLNNIFGVDLDVRAVEIAQLNLLLKIAEKKKILPTLQQNIQNGNSLIDDEKFAEDKAFNWKLGFPEIMEKRKFDVVIGNPPYVRQEELGEFKPYFEANYDAYKGTADLLVYFFEKGISLLREGGYFGFIASNKFMRSDYGENLRKYILEHCSIDKIIDFGELPVFKDASTFPCIFIFQKKKPLKNHKFLFCSVRTLDFSNVADYVAKHGHEVDQSSLGADAWMIAGVEVFGVIEKMNKQGESLKKYSQQPLYGIKTGFNEAFVIDEATKNELVQSDSKNREIIFPTLRGKDITPYGIENPKLWLIVSKDGMDIPKEYPEIYKHLSKYRKELEKRADQGEHWYNLRPCTYYKEFEKPKIIYGDISLRNRFTIDTENYYPLKTCFIIPKVDKYLLALLNSKLFEFYMRQQFPVLGDPGKGGRILHGTTYMNKLPIKVISQNKQQPIIQLVDKMLSLNKRLNEIGDKKTDERYNLEEEIKRTDAEIDELVYKLYGITEEEKKIIEGSLK